MGNQYTLGPPGVNINTIMRWVRSVRCCEPPNKIFPRIDSFILLLPQLPTICTRNRLDKPIKIRIAKIGHAIARWVHGWILLIHPFPRRRLHNSMESAFDLIIRPPREQITCIYHNGVGNGRDVDKGSPGRSNLQPAPGVLEE
ncbi:hypothetical protein I7I53_03102 [Histoplasma capsulatum var. duboisii H88]|uniref:Uncharacterized protein n=1 Tax=Ajellomyces capsulatus (strain H88) TaxID=544711 RepID=A0A8A1LMU2_AJEC8|nr:hypothetical protein I7I53_03102 [Histoplasma capsulatum var. duboisii H88]